MYLNKDTLYSFRHSSAIEIFKRTGSTRNSWIEGGKVAYGNVPSSNQIVFISKLINIIYLRIV